MQRGGLFTANDIYGAVRDELVGCAEARKLLALSVC